MTRALAGQDLHLRRLTRKPAVDDIGRFGARAFTDAESLNGRALDVAGDEATMSAAATLAEALGRSMTFCPYANRKGRAAQRRSGGDARVVRPGGYNADVAGLEREFGFRPMTLAEWASAKIR